MMKIIKRVLKKKKKDTVKFSFKLKNTTLNVPDIYDNALWYLVNQGEYRSRSEIIRKALKQFLKKEIMFSNTLYNVKKSEKKK